MDKKETTEPEPKRGDNGGVVEINVVASVAEQLERIVGAGLVPARTLFRTNPGRDKPCPYNCRPTFDCFAFVRRVIAFADFAVIEDFLR